MMWPQAVDMMIMTMTRITLAYPTVRHCTETFMSPDTNTPNVSLPKLSTTAESRLFIYNVTFAERRCLLLCSVGRDGMKTRPQLERPTVKASIATPHSEGPGLSGKTWTSEVFMSIIQFLFLKFFFFWRFSPQNLGVSLEACHVCVYHPFCPLWHNGSHLKSSLHLLNMMC